MSSRTPVSDGLATGPAERSELLSHRYWGRYTAAADLPNAASNAAANPAFERLRAGDVAYVTGDSTLYQCTSPGTLGGADATWATLGGGGGSGTIRSSHIFVVGHQGYLQVLAAQGDPPMPTNNANLDPTPVGPAEIEGVTCDYLDTGNGLELDQALLAAAARPGGSGVDIRLRPCLLNLADSVVPLSLPSGCRLIGAGKIASTIRGNTALNGASQKIIYMGSDSALIGLNLVSPIPQGVPPALARQYGFIQDAGSNWEVRDCRLQLDVTNNQTRWERYCIGDQSGSARVINCVFVGGNGWIQPTPSEVGCIFWGQDTYGIAVDPLQPGLALGNWSDGFNTPVWCKNVNQACSVDDWSAERVSAPNGAFRWEHDFVVGADRRLGSFRNIRVEVNNFDRGVNTNRVGIFVAGTRGNRQIGGDVSSCRVQFQSGPVMNTEGLTVFCSGGVFNLNLRGVVITGNTGIGQSGIVDSGIRVFRSGNVRMFVNMHQISVDALRAGGIGIWLGTGSDHCAVSDCLLGNDASPGGGTIGILIEASFNNKVCNTTIRNCDTGIDTAGGKVRITGVTAGGLTTNGVIVRSSTTQGQSGIVNCSWNGAGNAVNILAGVNDTIVVANNLNGLPILDAGIASVIANNAP